MRLTSDISKAFLNLVRSLLWPKTQGIPNEDVQHGTCVWEHTWYPQGSCTLWLCTLHHIVQHVATGCIGYYAIMVTGIIVPAGCFTAPSWHYWQCANIANGCNQMGLTQYVISLHIQSNIKSHTKSRPSLTRISVVQSFWHFITLTS